MRTKKYAKMMAIVLAAASLSGAGMSAMAEESYEPVTVKFWNGWTGNDGEVLMDMVDEFKLCNVYAKKECQNCFARFYCSGGCAANAYHCHNDINQPYEIGCELQRKRVECAIMLKAAREL